jgi:hypothetical protein
MTWSNWQKMADLAQAIRSSLVGSTAMLSVFSTIAKPGYCECGTESQSDNAIQRRPRIWYQRSEESDEVDLGGTGGICESSWDLEVIDDNLATPQRIAKVARRFLNGKRGTMGSTAFSVQGIFVEDHNDDYIPRGVGADSGEYVAALRLRIFHTST